jgi:hypothetical protein
MEFSKNWNQDKHRKEAEEKVQTLNTKVETLAIEKVQLECFEHIMIVYWNHWLINKEEIAFKKKLWTREIMQIL